MKISQREASNTATNLVVTTSLKTSFDSRWSQIKISGKNIKGRSNHVSIFFDERMYVHGGHNPDEGILGDFWCIDLGEGNGEFVWERLGNEVDEVPIKLKSHSAVIYKTKIVMFGGETGINQDNNCLFIYDIVTKKWKKIDPFSSSATGPKIPTIDSHSVCVIGDRMYLYGGYIADEGRYMRDILCLGLEDMKWSTVYESVAGKGKEKGMEQGLDETEPQPRSSSSMVAYGDALWIFGGSNGVNTLNDLWKFDIKTGKWEKIVSNHTPQPRRGHSTLVYKNYLFLFGGIQDVTRQKNDVYIYQFTSNNWSKIHTYTNSIYECSPTLKKSRKEQSTKSIQNFSIHRLSPLKSSQSGDDLMKRIMNENRQKKFQEKKKQMMKEFNQKHEQQAHKRRISPTTESMMKSLQSVGDQEDNKNGYKKQIIYDETHRFIVGKKPCARDGQTVALHGEKMYIFGGDRHLMCFNDLYWFDLEKGVKSLELYRTA